MVDISAISTAATEMLKDTMVAAVDVDPQLCYFHAEHDDRIDQQCEAAPETAVGDPSPHRPILDGSVVDRVCSRCVGQ